MKNKLGILGGMGPMAGIYFNQLLVSKTNAQKDQDHLETILYTNPAIPDRTQCILQKDNSIIYELAKGLIFLENCGCNQIVIACNTAHYYIPQLESFLTKAKILNLVEITAQKLKQNEIKKCIILATSGTINSGIYEKLLNNHNIETIVPNIQIQQQVMDIIYKYKSNKPNLKSKFKILIEKIVQIYGITNIIVGCTELSILKPDSPYSIFDPLDLCIENILRS